MAESALDRLLRIAKEKKSAQAQPTVTLVEVEAAVTEVEAGIEEVKQSHGIVETKLAILSMQIGIVDRQIKEELANARVHTAESAGSSTVATGSGEGQNRGTTVSSEPDAGSSSSEGTVSRISAEAASSVESGSSSVVTSEPSFIGTSDHPLAMQFAELEAALLAEQPEFKTILRQIHRHLGQEPELVTQMTEQEIQMIVSGLVVFANAEIVAPAIAKTAKAAIKAAKAKPISADDL